MESIWRDDRKRNPFEYPALFGEIQADAVVIGGGMAGILIAWFLRQAGVHAVLLEADRVGSGQTMGTTAKITSQHGLIYEKLCQTMGEERAEQYARANQRAIQDYRTLIMDQNIDCEFRETNAYLYAVEQENRINLEKEASAAEKLGIPANYHEKMAGELPFLVEASVQFSKQAQFHPLRFLYSLMRTLIIYEHSRVIEVEEHGVRTRGGRVRAESVIFATHYPFVNIPGYFFTRIHQERSCVLALRGAQSEEGIQGHVPGMYYGIDGEKLSVRTAGEILLLGGASYRTGENKEGGKYKELENAAKKYWPEKQEILRWSAQDCITVDGVPYIGCFSAKTPNWYVATGFQKWGMTSSMVSARIIRDLILKKENDTIDVFSPQRFTPSSISSFVSDGIHAVKDLSRQIWKKPKIKIEDLEDERGGIVEYEGEKYGVYKEANGEVFLVSTRCPHLGCQLEWNPDEKSWDCPCHGSRFDYKGNLINDPAQEGLQHEE